MSKINADTIETASPNVDITLGAAGDAVLIPTGATLKTNTIQDAGGNTIFTSDGSGTLSSIRSGLGGSNISLLTTNTFTGTTTSNFTTKINSTYKLYIFKFIDINPATDDANLTFQVSTDGGSNYNTLEITNTYFSAYHKEDDSGTPALAYQDTYDSATSTSYVNLSVGGGNGADECMAGELQLFNPSQTTYIKYYNSHFQMYHEGDMSYESFTAGVVQSASDVDAISFKMSSGNMDGIIKMYGIG